MKYFIFYTIISGIFTGLLFGAFTFFCSGRKLNAIVSLIFGFFVGFIVVPISAAYGIIQTINEYWENKKDE